MPPEVCVASVTAEVGWAVTVGVCAVRIRKK
jgi:hypothetical protein